MSLKIHLLLSFSRLSGTTADQCNKLFLFVVVLCVLSPGDHVRQDSMDFSKEWEDPTNCRCTDRLKPLERRKARQHQRCLAHSLVGTPNYIAPEVLLRTGTVDQRERAHMF